jgi:hypothetical protein
LIELAIAAGAAAGFASIPHCAGMCGPLAAFAGGRGARAQLGYQGGRLASYGGLGALAGASGGVLGDALPERWGSALLSFGLALALALAARRLWRGARREEPALLQLGSTKRASTLVERAFARLPERPFLLGALSALLPCGALYAAVLAAAGTGGPHFGAASMMTFAIVSGLGLALVGAVASKVRARIAAGADALFLSRILATALLVGAIVLAVRPVVAHQEPAATCHDPAPQPSSPGP